MDFEQYDFYEETPDKPKENPFDELSKPETDTEQSEAASDSTAPEAVDASASPEKEFSPVEFLAEAYRQKLLQEDAEGDKLYTVQPGLLEERVALFKEVLTEDFSHTDNLSNFDTFNIGSLPTEALFKRLELLKLDQFGIFSDIDGTITDNSGELNPEAVKIIKNFMKAGGLFIPVTGRARFQSVEKLVNELDVPFIVINNGAEIFDHNGERIWGREIPFDQYQYVFEKLQQYPDAVWMQNKKNPATGEEFLYTNGTPETDQAMLDVGIVDNVSNEVGRIGLESNTVDAAEVINIPGQNYKIQIMSPNAETIKALYADFQAQHIPCMLNMQSKQDGEYHWVEVIVGTKISGIQTLIDQMPQAKDLKFATVIGDGGNDLTMFKDLHSQSGEPILNTRTTVFNACDALKAGVEEAIKAGEQQKANGEPVTSAGRYLESTFDNYQVKDEKGHVTYALRGGASAIANLIDILAVEDVLRISEENFAGRVDLANSHRQKLYDIDQMPGAQAAIKQAVEEFNNRNDNPDNAAETIA